MTKKIYKRAMGIARGTALTLGVAVMMALLLGVATTALAGTGVGARFDLGKTNTVNAVTKLVGSVAGPSLQVDNNSTNAAATALDLQVEPGKAPMKVNSDAKVTNLNSDKLDNLDSSAFFRSTYTKEKATDSNGIGSPGALDPIFCDAGDFAMGGGYSAVDSGTQIIMNRPNGEGWAVSWRNGATIDTIVVHVVCADVGTPHQQ
jgi:hypothetical protein